MLFSHRLLHWGSRGPCVDAQRISVSFAFADPAWEPPYLADDCGSFPPLDVRLGLACGQLISYYQRFDVYGDKLRRAREIFKAAARGGAFREEYVRKVAMESAGALRLCELSAAPEDDGDDGTANGEDDGDDALLEAMLDAAEAGCTDIFDEEEEEDSVDDAL